MAWSGAVWAADVQVQLLDVGAGEATLIRAGGQDILVNGGSQSSATRLVKLLKAQGVRRLAMWVVMHHDSLRSGAAETIMRSFPIQRFLGPRGGRKEARYKALLRHFRKKRVSTKPARKGQVFSFGEAKLRVLDSGSKGHSLVTHLEHGALRVLFLGAMESKAMRSLMRKRKWLRSQIVKLSSFGSDEANPEALLRASGAKFAVVAAPRQGAFTPAEEVSSRLHQMGAKIASVGREGHIWLRSDGQSIWISTAKRHDKGYVPLSAWTEKADAMASTQGAGSGGVRLEDLPSDDDAGSAFASSRSQGPETPAPSPQAMQEDGSWYRTRPLGKEVINRAPFSSKGGYVGHRRSRHFHRAGCRSLLYIPKNKRVRFQTRKQALRARRVPAGDCLP